MKDSAVTEPQAPAQAGRQQTGAESGSVLSQEAIGLAEKLVARLPADGAVVVLGSLSAVSEAGLATQIGRAMQLISSKEALLVEASQWHGRNGVAVGLMELLRNGLPLEEGIEESEPLKRVPFGNPPANATELVVSDRFRELLEQARSRFAWVILQCWNLPALREAVTMVSRADAVVVFCKSGQTQARDVRAIQEMCAQVKTEFLGVVLT